jgi:ATP-dependent Clp protease ATP-binding subunit ClpC
MWERFTERARRVIFFAQQEAARVGQCHVDTQHLLLALLREEDNVACLVLSRLGVDLEQVRAAIEPLTSGGSGESGGDMQLTAAAKRVIDLAYDAARRLNHAYIGTEHLLLGLIALTDGLTARVLAKHGPSLDLARREVDGFTGGVAFERIVAASTKRLV